MTLEHFDAMFAFVVILTGLSLLITVLTQATSALLGLRGTNLLWGIKTLLVNADPNLEKHAEDIARAALHHPLVSDSMFSGATGSFFHRWRLATAIRKDELVTILHSFTEPREVVANATEAKPASPEWKTALTDAFEKIHPKDAEALLAISPQIQAALGENQAGVDRLMKRVKEPAEKLTRHIDRWFNPMMDRISQRFSMHTRVWTAIFAVLLSFSLQLDAFRLFTKVSTDAEMRGRLIASAESLSRKADEVLAMSAPENSAAYVLAVKKLIADHQAELKKLPEPTGFSTLSGGDAWLKSNLTAVGITDQDTWLVAYREMVPQVPLRLAAEQLHSLVTSELALQLLPDPYPEPFYRDWHPNSRRLWGIIATAALLSLGAPFWFNLLKNLSNLRPLLAKKEEEDRQPSATPAS